MFIILLGCCVTTSVWAQTVTTKISNRSITSDDTLEVHFTFSGPGEPQLPQFGPDWKLIRRREQQSSSSSFTVIINGKVVRNESKKERTIITTLQPLRAGTLSVGGATLVERGRVLASSRSIDIHVRGIQAQAPSQADNPNNLPRQSIIVVPEFKRDWFYVGEPVVATWTLLVQKGQRINEPEVDELTLPETVQRESILGDQIREEPPARTLFGRTFHRIPIFREIWTVIRPQEELAVPGLRVQVNASPRDFFSRPKLYRSAPMALQVRPVPSEGRPSDYREGTIGRFTLHARLHDDDASGRAILEIEIRGNGSLKIVDPPSLANLAGADARALPSDDRDEITMDREGVHGKRVFQYILTPKRAGKIVVPAVGLSFFNPDTGRFERTTTEQMIWEPKQAAFPTTKSPNKSAHANVELTARLMPLEHESSLASVRRTPVHQTLWFQMGLAGPFLIFLVVELWAVMMGRRQARSGVIRAKRALGTGRKRLRKAEDLAKAGKGAECFGELARTLRDYVTDRLGVGMSGLTNAQVHEKLGQKGLANVVIDQLIGQLERCDFARFAPSAAGEEDTREAIQRADAILAALEGATHA